MLKLLPAVSAKFTASFAALSNDVSNPLAAPKDQDPFGATVSQTPPAVFVSFRSVTVRLPLPAFNVTVNTPSSFPSGFRHISHWPTRSRSIPL